MVTVKGRLALTVLPQVWHRVRPRDCEDGSEPCPDETCRYRIDSVAHPEVTCAIDVAEDGEDRPTLRDLGRLLGVSNVAIYKTQRRALQKLEALGIQAFEVDSEG